MWKYLCYAVGFLFGAIMLFGGAFVLHTMPSLFAEKIKSMIPIVKGTDSYERYTKSGAPIQVSMYFFNVTNPNEVSLYGDKPILEQVGPFMMSETRRREVVKISPDNSTLDFKLFRTYFFNSTDSAPLDSVITLPNAPIFSAVFSARERDRDNQNTQASQAVAPYFTNETLYITRTADQWLFKGFKLDWLEALDRDGIAPEEIPEGYKFGFYYMKNNTWDQQGDGIVTIATASDGDISKIGKVVAWNGRSKMSFWHGDSCNALRGTEGQFFHPFVQKDEKLVIFAPDLCRSLSIEYIKTTVLRTIELYRYGLASSFFKPVNHNEETKCFCVKRSHEEKQKFCKLSGVMDASSCRKRPIVLSTPHFFNGDPKLREAVQGLSPSESRHDTYIDIEPITGLVLRVRRRLQVNLEMTASEELPASEVLNDKLLIHPLVWMDQSIVAPDESAQKLESKITKKIRLIKILCYAALISGPIILIATLIFICRDIRTEDKKIRAKKSTISSKKDNGGDYQKVQVILKPMNNSSNTTGGDSNQASNNKE